MHTGMLLLFEVGYDSNLETMSDAEWNTFNNQHLCSLAGFTRDSHTVLQFSHWGNVFFRVEHEKLLTREL